ncbi:MAG TPA: hypothetical protein VIO38_17240 [Rariglobus sp.]
MTEQTDLAEVVSLAERFALALASPERIDKKTGKAKEPKHNVDNDEYVAFVLRIIRKLEQRAIGDACLLPQMVLIAQRAAETVNTAIAANAELYAIDPKLGASMMECARALGIQKQSASDRKKLGEKLMAERIEAAGGVSFAEAKRERAAINKAKEHAEKEMADYIARHSAPEKAIGVASVIPFRRAS